MKLLPGDEGTDSEVVHRGNTLVLFLSDRDTEVPSHSHQDGGQHRTLTV